MQHDTVSSQFFCMVWRYPVVPILFIEENILLPFHDSLAKSIDCKYESLFLHSGLEEAQAGIKIAGRNISNLRYADDTTLMAESEEELKSRLMKVKEESEKVHLKLNIQKTKIMASGPITSWEIDGETV